MKTPTILTITALLLLIVLIPLSAGKTVILENRRGIGGGGEDPYVLLALQNIDETLIYNLTLNSGPYEVNLT